MQDKPLSSYPLHLNIKLHPGLELIIPPDAWPAAWDLFVIACFYSGNFEGQTALCTDILPGISMLVATTQQLRTADDIDGLQKRWSAAMYVLDAWLDTQDRVLVIEDSASFRVHFFRGTCSVTPGLHLIRQWRELGFGHAHD